MAEQSCVLIGVITLFTDESNVARPKEPLMSNPFDEFKGSPIDWDNIGNMSAISEIAMRFRPDQIRDHIRTSRIDPNDLLTVAGTLIELSFRDHQAGRGGSRRLD